MFPLVYTDSNLSYGLLRNLSSKGSYFESVGYLGIASVFKFHDMVLFNVTVNMTKWDRSTDQDVQQPRTDCQWR